MWIEPLTVYEIRVIDQLAKGYRDRRIAEELGYSADFARHLLHNAFEKTGCFSRIELALNWHCELFQIGLRELGIIPKEQTQ